MKGKFLSMGLAVVLLTASGIGLSGCKSVDPSTGVPSVSGEVVVDVSIVAVERSFTLAMQVASLYTNLPRCKTPGATVVCSDVSIVRTIRRGAIKAHDAILLARENQRLIGLAVSAVSEFSSLVPKS